MLFAFAAQFELELFSLDVSGAYMHIMLNELIYVTPADWDPNYGRCFYQLLLLFWFTSIWLGMVSYDLQGVEENCVNSVLLRCMFVFPEFCSGVCLLRSQYRRYFVCRKTRHV